MEEEIYVFKKIDAIKFGVMPPKMIKEMAAVKIVTPELYDKEGYPVDGGLMDTRLGVIDPGLKCKTCGSKLKECLGHFGYIELARPIIHVKFIKIINDLLKSTCKDCGKVLLSEEEISKNFKKLEKKVKKRSKVKKIIFKELILQSKNITKCPHCKAKIEKIRLEKPTNFYEGEKRLSPIEIRTRLEKIPDEDLKLFGYNPQVFRPEWAVLTLLAIPPVTMRPSITLESGERSEDDLTHKLGDVVRINQRLFENINAGAPEIIIEDLWDLLQYHITTFFDNNVAQLPPARHRSGQPLKTLTERIKSKEGRIRHNLAGKRTNFSSRTVISPDSMIAIDEVGIPLQVAMKLTVPERITEWNFEHLKEYVRRGPKQYPGANYISRPDGKKKKITEETKEQILNEELKIGYIVERHLINGDIAIFNRQPSLHRMSMMCHKIKVLPGLTFRLNPAVCAPYNADFDGDEMNLHIPQTEEARAEAEILMEVETQLISPRYGLGIIACNHDSIAGNYVLTKMLEMPRKDAIQLLASIGIENFNDLPKKEIVSGAEIFSVLIPNDFDFVGKARDGTKVVIQKGKIKEGFMDSSNLGSGSGLLIRNFHKKYGSKKTLEILGQMFRLGVKTLFIHGFTAAFSDTDLKEENKKEIEDVIKNAKDKVDDLIMLYEKGSLDAYPGITKEETLERKILEVLNKARNDAGRIISKSLDKTKNTLIMSISGARGNIVNLAQMAAIVGQQSLRGKRIERGYKKRTLSCFKKEDLRPGPRGFIESSFKKGMHPAEFFFMAMTGRDSLMDTALRTPKSGYLYRRLANAMQDLKIEYDSTVRNASKKIVQFQYGEDSIDVSKSEAGKINVKRIIDSVMEGE